MSSLLLSTAYFAPVHYYARMIRHDAVYIEKYENFLKQTYRNRCVILGGNGTVPLIVPVEKGRGPKILIKDIKIAYDMDWQRNQWNTLFSAYNSSPYFEFYEDDLRPLFTEKTKFLFDLNMKINELMTELIEIEIPVFETDDFEAVPEGSLNLREAISPKVKDNPDKAYKPAAYTQVFEEKFPFIPNLSILDLLFNEGPNSYTLLENSLSL